MLDKAPNAIPMPRNIFSRSRLLALPELDWPQEDASRIERSEHFWRSRGPFYFAASPSRRVEETADLVAYVLFQLYWFVLGGVVVSAIFWGAFVRWAQGGV